MFTGFDAEHDVVVGQGGGDGQDATAERLAQHQNVRLDVLVVDGQPPAGAAQTRLHLVGDPQHPVARAHLAHLSSARGACESNQKGSG